MSDYPEPHRARKRFGQNFLQDLGVITAIVSAIKPRASDALIEIGPGQGAITHWLLKACPRLIAIELDRDLIPRLQSAFGRDYPDFVIHQADALTVDFSQLSNASQPLRIVGNLPYNISTPLIFHLLSFHRCILDMHFMLQKEVVERMAAKPGHGDYGRLSLMTQYFCDVESLFDVGPECFDPRPKVVSAIVRLTPKTELPLSGDDFVRFDQLIRLAFQQRRKTLHNNLKGTVSRELFEQCDIDPGARPETLSLADYLRLARAWIHAAPIGTPP
jgi:16S rRNA (adenine1518-N6/adenine1519-N6)-dimethyltransferase